MSLSPLNEIIKTDVEEAFNVLIRDAVEPWVFFNSHGVHVKKADGGFISYGQSRDVRIQFNGTVTRVFWGTFVDDRIKQTSRQLIESTRLKASARNISATEALTDCLTCIHSMITKVFHRMAVIDQRLRGKGYPDRVKKVDVQSRIDSNFEAIRVLVESEIKCIQQSDLDGHGVEKPDPIISRRNIPCTDLSPELFPHLSPLEFTRRAREWIERWPAIHDVLLYAGENRDAPYALIIRTTNKSHLDASGCWVDSLIPLQSDLSSIHRSRTDYNIGLWQLFVLGLDEELPPELIHRDNCWCLYQSEDQKIGKRHESDVKNRINQGEISDENALWIVYSRTREVLLKDLYGHERCLAKPHFDRVNDNFFAFIYENPAKKFTLKQLAASGIDFNNKSLHKVIDELGFKGKLKKLFFKVAQDVVVFNNPVARDDLTEANIESSKEKLFELFFSK